jgi:hypothetical protein
VKKGSDKKNRALVTKTEMSSSIAPLSSISKLYSNEIINIKSSNCGSKQKEESKIYNIRQA